MGAVYLRNAVCLLPARPELVENLHYMAGAVEEMGGTCHLFLASPPLPHGGEALVQEFRAAADARLAGIPERLDRLQVGLAAEADPDAVEGAEEDLKRERVSYLRARRLAFFGSTIEAEVDARLDRLRRLLDDRYRDGK
ncbi:MAG TPA: hypothetical protein VGN26_23115 [Armatimonadota bacterium]|jgi:hypothetical protein